MGTMNDSVGKLVSQAQMGMTFTLKASIDLEFPNRVMNRPLHFSSARLIANKQFIHPRTRVWVRLLHRAWQGQALLDVAPSATSLRSHGRKVASDERSGRACSRLCMSLLVAGCSRVRTAHNDTRTHRQPKRVGHGDIDVQTNHSFRCA